MNRSQRIVVAVVVLAGIGGGALALTKRHDAKGATGPAASASASGAPADRVIPVTVTNATKKDVPVVVEGLGTVTALATVTVKSQVDGRLEKVLFEEGKPVKKGDALALVDSRPFSIQLQQGQAAFARDDANLKNARVNLDRYSALLQQKLVSQQQVDDQKSAVAQLEAATKADEAQMASAKLNLDYARIVSPIDGVTGVRLVDPGNIIHPNDASGIVVVTQLDPIAVIFTLPQDDLVKVQRAMAAGKPHVVAFARDGTTKLGEGDLSVIDNQIDPQTATVRLKAVMPNGSHALWPNQFVKARLDVDVVKGALVVPAAAVQRGPEGTFVYVVKPDQTVIPKKVEVASIEDETAILAKGVDQGDSVVTDGQNQLRPGAKVAAKGK